MPEPGRERDSRFSRISVSARIVSPANTGAGSLTSRQPRLTACSETSVTESPVTSASVNVESTSGRSHSVVAAYAASKWIGFVFSVSRVNQTLSASSTVRPKRLRYTAPTSNSSNVRLTPEIIAGMQQLALEQRRRLGPRAPWHVGDVAWGLRQHEGREHEWKIRLWRDGDRVVAWSWVKGATGKLEVDVHPDRPDLLDEILSEPD